MPYNTSSLYASVEMFLVITSSLGNGPIVNFSASFNATRSLVSGSFAWGESTQSISQLNQITIISSSLSESAVNNYVRTLSQSHINLINECDLILSSFVTGSNIKNLFTGSGITLT